MRRTIVNESVMKNILASVGNKSGLNWGNAEKWKYLFMR
jgi:hypothetical protein